MVINILLVALFGVISVVISAVIYVAVGAFFYYLEDEEISDDNFGF